MRVVAAPSRRPGRRRRTPFAVLKDLLPAIGAVGLVLYGLFRLAYVFFYVQLRTTPEEVGFDYSRILAASIAGAVELVLIAAVAIAVLLALVYLLRIGWSSVRARTWPGRSAFRQFDRPALLRLIRASVIAGAALVFLSLPALAWWQGRLAQNGQTVRNVYFVGIPYLPVLPVQAVPADVEWTDGDQGKSVHLSTRRCLFYLGEADGTAVLYDVSNHDSLRLPMGDLTISLRYSFYAPAGC